MNWYATEGKHVVADLLAKHEEGSIAVGDSENDVGMLELVDYPFCVNASPELLEVANARGWKVITPENAAEEILKVLT
ncbi:MAG: HAD hydrolase family protein [Patescibacteria group bacterium]